MGRGFELDVHLVAVSRDVDHPTVLSRTNLAAEDRLVAAVNHPVGRYRLFEKKIGHGDSYSILR